MIFPPVIKDHMFSGKTPIVTRLLNRLSLNALKAFEATARLRSFSAAADELGVTHGAVSRHVRALEGALGLLLLTRTAQGALATVEGQRLADGLWAAFGLIRTSLEQIEPGPLTLSCSESIMMFWLLPRLQGFQKANPGVQLRFNMGHGAVDFVRNGISVAIRLSTIVPPKEVVTTAGVTEWIGPVGSTDYLRSVRLRSVAGLHRARLMVSNTRPTAWQDWLRADGHATGEPRIDAVFDHFYLLIQAAKCGLGLASVPRMLVRDDLLSGALVAPLGFTAGPNRLKVWLAPHLSRRVEATRLVDWLDAELQASER